MQRVTPVASRSEIYAASSSQQAATGRMSRMGLTPRRARRVDPVCSTQVPHAQNRLHVSSRANPGAELLLGLAKASYDSAFAAER